MSLGVTAAATAAVVKAAKTTHSIIQSVQDAVSFDQVLNGGEVDGGGIEAGAQVNSSEPESTQSLLETAVNAIRRQLSGDNVLSKDGVSLTTNLRLSTRGDGTVQVQSPIDHAAAIEASLGSNSALKRLVNQLHARLGTTQIEVPGEKPVTADQRASIVDLTH